MPSVPLPTDRSQAAPQSWVAGIPQPHPCMPRSTARRGTRRVSTRIRKAMTNSLAREEALAAVTAGKIRPDQCRVIWSVDERPEVQPISEMTVPAGETLMPVRRIGSYRGAPNRVGMYPVIREGMALMLVAESRLELSWFHALDVDARVAWMAAQPFVLSWFLRDRALVHTCDLLCVVEGQLVAADVKPRAHITDDPYNRAVMTLTRRSLRLAGVGYRILDDMTPQRVANLRAVIRYRGVTDSVSEMAISVAAAEPRSVGRLVGMAGGPSTGRAALLHLLATGRCRANLDEPLHRATVLDWGSTPGVIEADLDRASRHTEMILGSDR